MSDFSVQFKDPNQKALVYSELVRIAKEKRADAIITINDAKLTNMVSARSGGAKQDLRTNEGTQDCIYLTVSGPAIRTWSVCLPYERAGYEIIWGDQSELLDDLLNLLPGWPANQPIAS